LIEDGKPRIDLEDEITRDTMATRGGEVTSGRVRELLGLAPLEVEKAPEIDEVQGDSPPPPIPFDDDPPAESPEKQ